jgi:hypothetical protein
MDNQNRTYDRIFSVDNDSKHTLDESKIGAIGMSKEEYERQFRKFLNESFTRLFDDVVRISWFRRIFMCHGKKTIYPIQKNPMNYNTIFVKHLRRIIGKDIQILTRSRYFSKIEGYFKDFFPGFTDGNPFTNPEYYKFPYKNITVDFLIPVNQLNDRLTLLKEADEQNMSYAVFLDYIIEFISKENEKTIKPRYEIKHGKDKRSAFYVRDTRKNLVAKRGIKRQYE